MEGESITKMFGKPTKFDAILNIVKLVKFDEESVVCSFIVDDTCVNLNGSLHGGYSATLIDVVSTLAFLAQDLTKAGVSVDLNASYLSTCQIGDQVLVVAKVLKLGKSVGFSTVDIIRAKDNVLIATGRHTKAFAPPKQPKPVAAAVEEKEEKPAKKRSIEMAPRPPKSKL